MDGGIADNLGLRSFDQLIEVRGGPREALRQIHHSNARQILIISVIAHAAGGQKEWELKGAAPSLSTIIGSITNAQISRYSIDTIDIVSKTYVQWTAQISTPEHPVTFNFVEVSFGAVADETERDALNRIGTSFSLSDEEVDRLISAARKVLRESPEFQDFLHRNRGNVDEQ